MASSYLNTAPVLSTPESNIFEAATPVHVSASTELSDEQLAITYEIERTIKEIRKGRWTRIALQFPDEMLPDAPRIYRKLSLGLKRERKTASLQHASNGDGEKLGCHESLGDSGLEEDMGRLDVNGMQDEEMCILADTSYGSCCVDEIAAEHVNAQVVVHYGRSCLSPTARLPLIYVFTSKPMSLEAAVDAFRETYQDKGQKIVLMADTPYSSHIPQLHRKVQEDGYTNVFAAEVIHNPSSQLPNRTVPVEVSSDASVLREYHIFHIGLPPTALLLTLSSRVAAIHIYDPASNGSKAMLASSSQALRRRYALITSVSAVSIYGILINTLSVSNYLSILSLVKQQIADAGKKSYTFVVGKINAAKIANFAEIGAWVVIGCWESSLVESRDFYRPVLTPFELELALMGDDARVWTGAWESDFQGTLERHKEGRNSLVESGEKDEEEGFADETWKDEEDDEDEDSTPPEFDLRTGRYVSRTRPMRSVANNFKSELPSKSKKTSSSLIKKSKGDVARIGGVVSPGAEFLKSSRTWQGLGSDFEIAYQHDGELIEEGRSGIARGYADGEASTRR